MHVVWTPHPLRTPSFCKDRGSGQWFKFNDEAVSSFNVADIAEEAFGGKRMRPVQVSVRCLHACWCCSSCGEPLGGGHGGGVVQALERGPWGRGGAGLGKGEKRA